MGLMKKLRRLARSTLRSYDSWARGRNWLFQVPVLLIMTFFYYQMMTHPDHSCSLFGINLVFHEMGHVLFRFAGEVPHFVGGSLLQCLTPVVSAAVLVNVGDFMGIPFCVLWLASNLFYVGWYINVRDTIDAPMVAFWGQEGIHDWNYLLGR
jgi:hypothetical protein